MLVYLKTDILPFQQQNPHETNQELKKTGLLPLLTRQLHGQHWQLQPSI